MKKTTITLLLLAFTTCAFAQEKSEMKTLFGNGQRSNGAYGAITTAYSEIDNRDAILIGARGAFLINHSVGIGLSGRGFLTQSKLDNQLNQRYMLAGGYGGLFMEFIIAPKSPIHLSIPMTIGAGAVSYIQGNDTFIGNDFNTHYEDSQPFFVAESGLEIELSVVKFMRIGLGATYRYTSQVQLQYADNGQPIIAKDALNGFSGGITFKFGKF